VELEVWDSSTCAAYLLSTSPQIMGWFHQPNLLLPMLQDAAKKLTPSSCQAGGVVHILSANGTKMPVTLKMSTREDARTSRSTHVVQVFTRLPLYLTIKP
jgi:hypothetical protein